MLTFYGDQQHSRRPAIHVQQTTSQRSRSKEEKEKKKKKEEKKRKRKEKKKKKIYYNFIYILQYLTI